MNYETIIFEKIGPIGLITLNRPDRLNALSRKLYSELNEAVVSLESDESISVIVLTGAGEKAFSAGGDIHERAEFAKNGTQPEPEAEKEEYAWRIGACKKPTIGALNGLAYGGAAVLSSSLDIRIGCERTKFRFLAVSYGRVNSTWSLPMQVGWPVAKELLFTGRVVESEEAYKIGLLNHLVPSDKLKETALGIANQIAENDDRMVQGVKDLMLNNVGEHWKQMFQNELSAQKNQLAPTPVLEGFKEFLDRKGKN